MSVKERFHSEKGGQESRKMRTKTRRSIGSCSVAAIGDSMEPEEAEWQKNRTGLSVPCLMRYLKF